MAAAWVELLPGLVGGSDEGEQQRREALAELVAAITRDTPTALALVTSLGPYLTTENDGKRAKAITLLAEVRRQLPSLANRRGLANRQDLANPLKIPK